MKININRGKVKRIVLSVYLLFVLTPVTLWSQSFLPGKMNHSVVCQADSSIYYTLYLPSSYTDNRLFSVMYVFDPAGNATYALSLLQEQAESYGYILASSPQILNGEAQTMLHRAEMLIQDVERRFTVDEQRRYLAGFSGGARMAIAIAGLTSAFEGIIACGAGLTDEPENQIKPGHDYLFFGFVGLEDFNYSEMYLQQDRLEELGIDHILHVFKGAHHWPAEKEWHFAFEWLELQAMKRGLKEINLHYVDSIYHNDLYHIEVLKMNDKLLDLEKSYAKVIALYSPWKDCSNIIHEQSLLQQSEMYQDMESFSMELLQYELGAINEIDFILDRVYAFERIYDTDWIDWKNIIKEMNSETDNYELKLTSKRILNYMFRLSVEWAEQKLGNKEFKAARLFYKLQNEVSPKHPDPEILKCRSYALEGNPKKAIKSLKKAIKYGFDDFQYLFADPAFESLVDLEDFEEILAEAGFVKK